MGLGLGCFGAAAERKVSPDARQSGQGPEAKEQRGVVMEKGQKGGEAAEPVAAGRKEKKRDHQKAKASIVMQHHFPFHSRPGLL